MKMFDKPINDQSYKEVAFNLDMNYTEEFKINNTIHMAAKTEVYKFS